MYGLVLLVDWLTLAGALAAGAVWYFKWRRDPDVRWLRRGALYIAIPYLLALLLGGPSMMLMEFELAFSDTWEAAWPARGAIAITTALVVAVVARVLRDDMRAVAAQRKRE
jgi:hypothetical protein